MTSVVKAFEAKLVRNTGTQKRYNTTITSGVGAKFLESTTQGIRLVAMFSRT